LFNMPNSIHEWQYDSVYIKVRQFAQELFTLIVIYFATGLINALFAFLIGLILILFFCKFYNRLGAKKKGIIIECIDAE